MFCGNEGRRRNVRNVDVILYTKEINPILPEPQSPLADSHAHASLKMSKDIDDFIAEYAINILVVEDNLADLRILQETLKSNNFKINIYHAVDGEYAINFLNTNKDSIITPDIILLDLNLPKKDGFEVLQDIKNDKKLTHIPVIIVTGSDANRDVIKSYNLHANAYVVKPINIDDFISAIKSLGKFWFTVVRLPPRT